MPTIYPGPVCPSFLQLEDVFCFGGLYLDLLLRFRHNKQVSRAFREVGLLLIVFTCIAANFPIRFSATIPGCRSFIFAILPIVDHFLVGDVRGTATHIKLFVNCGTHAWSAIYIRYSYCSKAHLHKKKVQLEEDSRQIQRRTAAGWKENQILPRASQGKNETIWDRWWFEASE